jgi:large subunit ribosomal protein L25
MSASEILKAEKREKVGTRASRKLRAQGRIPASIQAPGDDVHIDFSIVEHDFLATRRHHTHLYDIDIAGVQETAVVNELQWDTFGDRILHVEFKRVKRGEKTESTVQLEFFGHPKGGVLNHLVNDITVSSIPSLIPDSIEIKVDHLEPGDTILASQLDMPEGVEIAIPGDTMIAVVAIPKEVVDETAAEGEEGEVPPTDAGEAPAKPEGGEPAS